MEQHNGRSTATDAAEWRAICEEVAAAGFQAIEVWEAHASPPSAGRARASRTEWKPIMDGAGLKPVAYAGRCARETLRICQWLGDSARGRRSRDHPPDEATALCREYGIRFNIENHPQKSSRGDPREDRRRQRVARGLRRHRLARHAGRSRDRRSSRSCGDLVRHTHIKDVEGGRGSTPPASSARVSSTCGLHRGAPGDRVRRLVLVGGRARGPQPLGVRRAQPPLDREAGHRLAWGGGLVRGRAELGDVLRRCGRCHRAGSGEDVPPGPRDGDAGPQRRAGRLRGSPGAWCPRDRRSP